MRRSGLPRKQYRDVDGRLKDVYEIPMENKKLDHLALLMGCAEENFLPPAERTYVKGRIWCVERK